ncbi:inositol monophosphatase family protein [Pullulanibacillus sp. KACC 23026]|uniref:inositol monophosphatase family protein n=1 Tax=Pullulanibacillus sp. KACC 23026 TaxID=3028315 RepID=UPI0023B19AFB|nr:inositol monophosphatase family protein [Pullulanibacillus sp. KACC 23026]WEG11717.1 inositol monophosphatase family protein [Pullulanibacillus sp. KACC 23026]
MSEQIDWYAIRDRAKEWILDAGEQLKEALKSTLQVETKSSPDDLVTNMDRQIEEFFIQHIRESFPGHYIISEEGYGDKLSELKGIIWMIDPIDGTMNFVHQKRHFSISIGVYENGVGRVGLILDVMNGDLYHCVKGSGAFQNDSKLPPLTETSLNEAVISINATWLNQNRRIDPDIVRPIARQCRGTRSYGSAAIELAYVACGALDLYWSMRLAPWDIGAGLILVEEVGGAATRVDGSPINLLKQNSLLVGNPSVHQTVSNHIQQEIESGKFVEQYE